MTQVQPSLDANSRAQQLHQANSWMPIQTIYALVDSGLSDTDIYQATSKMRTAAVANDQAGAVKNLASQVNPTDVAKTFGVKAGVATQSYIKAATPTYGFKQFFDDPVLQKAPSASLALKQYLSGAVGAWPVGQADLVHQQQQLQLRGFGGELPADGSWSPAWNAAWAQYADHLYKSQISGEGPASFSLNTVMQGLNALLPVNAFDATLGFIKSIPTSIRTLAADLAGGAAGAYYSLTQDPRVPFFSQASKGEYKAYGETAANVVNVLGGDTTGKKEASALQREQWARVIQDVSTVWLLTDGMALGGRFANAIGEAPDALTAAAAYRGPGVIARTLGTPAGRATAGAVLGGGATALAGGTPLQVAAAAAGGGTLGYLSTTNAFNNLPILKNTGPLVDSLTDADGLYYKARRLVAAPYQYRPVQIAGQTFQDLSLYGAKIRGAAAAQSAIAPTSMSQAVQGEHTFSAVDDAIKHRLGFTVLGAHIEPSINDLMFVLHAGPEFASSQVGEHMNTIMEGLHHSLGDPGWAAAIQRITGRSVNAEIERLGGLENYQRFWSNKIAEHASWWAAENQRNVELAGAGLPAEESLSSTERFDDLRARAREIRNDPQALRQALTEFRGQGINSPIEEFVARVKRDEATNIARPAGETMQDARTFTEASKFAQQKLLPWQDVPVPNAVRAAETETIPGMTGAGQNALQNTTGEKNSLGLARLDSLTKQDAFKTISKFRARYAELQARVKAPLGPALEVDRPALEEANALDLEVNDFLYREFHIDGTQMPQQGPQKLDKAQDFAERLATGVYAHPDAPQAVKDAIGRLAEMGYKPVTGTDIGWMLHGAAPVDALEGPLTWQRKLAGHIGLNPTAVPDRTISSYRGTGIISEIDAAVKRGDVVLPPYMDATTIYKMLQNGDFIDKSPGFVKDTVQTLFRVPQRVAKREELLTVEGKLDVNRARDELNKALQPRDIPRTKFVEAFTNPQAFSEMAPATQTALNADATLEEQLKALDVYGTMDVAPMSRKSAEALYRAVVKGTAAPEAYMLGASRLDDLFRASMGFAGKGIQYRAGAGALFGAGAAYAVDPSDPNFSRIAGGAAAGATLAALGGDKLGWAMANLPNKLVQLRNELRFELDPWFSFRRIAKANVKMAAEGVPPTADPLVSMKRAGTLDESRSVLQRVEPEFHSNITDDADRYLQSQDVFGFYNHRDFEAYAAGHWAQQGFTDDQIKAKLVKVFEYGTGGVAKRNAIERTTNFFFFPFSFEKTVYRNIGGYLLDHPGQMLLLTRAFSAYNDFNANHMDGSNPLATSFYTKHLPILNEATQLNAFAHGMNLGEPGGVNRPLLNLFLPQNWQSSKSNLAALQRFIPAVRNFQRVYAEAADQRSILEATGVNMWRDLKGIPATYGSPAQSTLTKQAQLEEAFTMQREWFANYAAVIDHNSSTRTAANKINFPLSAEWGKYAGEPITKANIREIIHGHYPDYDPNGAVVAATTASETFKQYLLDTKGSPLHEYVQSFADNTLRLGRGMSSGKFSGAQVAEYTAGLRAQAVYIAERDSRFYSLYAKNFRGIIGPLEAVR